MPSLRLSFILRLGYHRLCHNNRAGFNALGTVRVHLPSGKASLLLTPARCPASRLKPSGTCQQYIDRGDGNKKKKRGFRQITDRPVIMNQSPPTGYKSTQSASSAHTYSLSCATRLDTKKEYTRQVVGGGSYTSKIVSACAGTQHLPRDNMHNQKQQPRLPIKTDPDPFYS